MQEVSADEIGRQIQAYALYCGISELSASPRCDKRPRRSASASEQRRPLRPSRDTGASGRQVNASASQDEEHQQPVQLERGDTEANSATHPLY